MFVEEESEHMVLTETKGEKLLCICIECVAAWLTKHCNTIKKKTPAAGKQCYLHFEM